MVTRHPFYFLNRSFIPPFAENSAQGVDEVDEKSG